jgi:threonine/homoserine/homoserine lactone efflux protein
MPRQPTTKGDEGLAHDLTWMFLNPRVATGSLLLATAGALGVAVLLGRSSVFDAALHVAGGLYLAYLGVKMWRGARSPVTGPAGTGLLLSRRSYVTGMVTVLTNPKGLIFFGSVLTALLPQSVSSPVRTAAVLAIAVSSLCWHSSLAVVFSTAFVQSVYGQVKPVMDLVSGAVFIGLGFTIAAAVI